MLDFNGTTTQDEEYTIIPRHYLPRDGVNEKHILTIIGSRNQHKQDIIDHEMKKVMSMKRKFNNFARKMILMEYISAAKNLGWTLAGQDLTNFNHLKKYIATSKWDEKLQHDLHFIQYKRFKIDIRLHRWDYTLCNQFCTENKIKFIDEENTEGSCHEEKTGVQRSCFAILATAIKNDYNKKIRNVCVQIHGQCIKERQESMCGENVGNGERYFNWSNKFVCKKTTSKKHTPDPTETVEYWKDQVQELKQEVSELKQKNSDMAEMNDDFDFDDMFVSFRDLFCTCHIFSIFLNNSKNIYDMTQAGKSRRPF